MTIIQKNRSNSSQRVAGDGITYARAGVDIDKASEVLAAILPHCLATQDDLVLNGLGPFSSAVQIGPIIGGMEDPIMIQSTDGPGTGPQEARGALDAIRVSAGVGYIYEDTALWDAMGNGFVTLGYNNVIHSLTDLSCTSPLFVPATIIDSIDSTDMDPDIHERILRGMMEACLDFPQPYPRIVGGECAQLKGTIADHQYNFNVTATGFVDRIHVLNPKGNIRPGNVVVGFASDGIHLNGFSLQRAILESFCLDGTPEGSEETFLQLLIRRQPNYAKIIRTIAIEGLPIVALAHITGGGLFDNNLRNLPEDCRMVIDASAWEVPFFMKWLVENGQVEPFEAYRSWNMGIGFTVTCFNMAEAEMCVSLAKKLGQKAYIIGGIVEGDCGVEILLP